MSRNDRRREPRVQTDLGGVVQHKNQTDEVVCRVANLSRSGALAVSSHRLTEMAQVHVRIQVAESNEFGKNAFHCDAAVVRCDPRPDGSFDLGLFFTAMTPEDRTILEGLIKNRPVIRVN